ncbi:PREDICTED: uncharacterized protein LOC109153561 [Ipomoea nil]|uniref:uncharacterized protein LOC109153561 n=1 Tax=Ipomoea nil TaxID=35883 RepID=UPI00090158F7|nr:PREDICTED: uncharacterized protein LOC109153561 [Ipomoea nil]XP_019156962.1 PREDICTED: uncharacterized protein LOC109153561 [Ipomoea nil]
MDRSWMYEKRTTLKYMQGVQEFIQYAEKNKSKKTEEFIVCPCCDCKNLRGFRSSEQVKSHLIRRGFKKGYSRWVWHGENLYPSISATKNEDHVNSESHAESDSHANSQTNANNEENDETRASNDENDEDNDRMDEMMHDVQGDFSEMPPEFKRLFDNVEKPLFSGCTNFTELTAALKLYNLKAKNGWSDKSFTGLLELQKDMVASDNELSNSIYKAKTTMSDQSASTFASDPTSVSAPKRRGPNTRGPNNCKNLKKKKKTEDVSIEFDEYNRPIGPYSKQFVSYIGISVRSKVDININNWHSVDQCIKDTIWKDVKKEFAIQDDSKKNVVLKIASSRWKDFKSRLLREYVVNKHPNYESPVQVYDYLTEEQWARFVADRESEQFKEIRQKARERCALNEHPHFLGSAGYAGKRLEWMISDPLSSQPSCASISSSLVFEDRSFDWVRARVKKSKDGSYYIPNEKTQEVFHKIVDKCEEVSKGSFQPKRHHDILSAALGKEDYSGSVRGVGKYSTIRDVFGKPERKQVITVDDVKKLMEKCKQDTVLDVQSKIDILNQQLNILMRNMSTTHPLPQDASVGTPQSVHVPFDLSPIHSSCHSIDAYPVTTIKENVKISSPRQNKKNENQSGEVCTIGTRPPIVGDDVLQHLGDNCKQLVNLLIFLPSGKDYIDLEIDQTIFHHRNVSNIYVMMEDIQDLLMMNWLDVSIIQVFILFLNRLCNESGVTSIGFACPTQISEDMVNLNSAAVTTYLIHVMDQHKNKQFILAPYHQEHHWLLLVICVCSRNVYVFDPKACNRTIEVKPCVNIAFRSLRTNGRGPRTGNWKQCKCPQQPGGVECGYYVLRYMYEMVTKYSSIDCLDEVFEQNSYSINEIDEIRDLWAKHFLEECV